MKDFIKYKFGILLENGHIALIAWANEKKAREAYRKWKQSRRDSISAGDIVTPRQALGFVRYGYKPGDPAASTIGRRGGIARAASMTPAQRSECARKAANARWKSNLEGNTHGK